YERRSARAHAGGVEQERRLMEGDRRFGAFVVVQRLGTEPVAAAAGCEVVERSLQAVAAEEPLERLDRPASVFGSARQGEGGELGFDERCGVERLLVAFARRRFAPVTSKVSWKAELSSV